MTEDPRQMEVFCGLINTASMEVLDEKLTSKINQAINSYLEYVMPYVKGESTEDFHWNEARNRGKNIERLIGLISGSLDKGKLAVFTLGLNLADWETFEYNKDSDEFYDQSKLDQIQKYLSAIFETSIPTRLLEMIEKYKTYNVHKRLNIPTRMYSLTRNSLIDLELFGE